jgi:hypothetical protein
MKAIWIYLAAAMAVVFTLPATAAEGWEGFAPVYSEAAPVLAITDDSPMLAERSAMRQLEAAVVAPVKPHDWPEDEGVSWCSCGSSDGPHEVGWRS